jgi:hypothetical protein
MLPHGYWTINSIFILAPPLRATDRRRPSFCYPIKTLLTPAERESRMKMLLAYLTITRDTRTTNSEMRNFQNV